MGKYLLIASTAFILLAAGCGKVSEKAESQEQLDYAAKGSSTRDMMPSPSVSAERYDEAFESEAPIEHRNKAVPQQVDKKIIWTAEVRFEVKNYKKCRAEIDSIISVAKGYISSENEYSSDGALHNTIVVKVPCENFRALVDALVLRAYRLDYKNIASQDVTEEYVDLDARLVAKRRVEERYYDILSRAKTIPDILAVESQLRIIREEIESSEGRIRYFDNRIAYSTVNLYIYEPGKAIAGPKTGFLYRIGRAFSTGWMGLLELIIGLVKIWPLILIIAIVICAIKAGLSHRKRRKASA